MLLPELMRARPGYSSYFHYGLVLQARLSSISFFICLWPRLPINVAVCTVGRRFHHHYSACRSLLRSLFAHRFRMQIYTYYSAHFRPLAV